MAEEAETLSARWRAAGGTIDLHAEMSRVTLSPAAPVLSTVRPAG